MEQRFIYLQAGYDPSSELPREKQVLSFRDTEVIVTDDMIEPEDRADQEVWEEIAYSLGARELRACECFQPLNDYVVRARGTVS